MYKFLNLFGFKLRYFFGEKRDLFFIDNLSLLVKPKSFVEDFLFIY